MLNKQIKEKIMKHMISFEKYGLNDLAWNKEDAQHLIYSIMNDSIGILGGDVYRLSSSDPELLYDNWACEPFARESEKQYYLRSKQEALKYIQNYPLQDEVNIVFSLVFTESLDSTDYPDAKDV